MPTIFDSISSEQKELLIRKGDVYKMKLSEEEGVTPKYSDQDSRNKYFVVVGKDEDENAIGFLLINSNINQNIPQHLKKFHYPIKLKKYPFLSYNSHVDCNHIKSIAKKKFLSGSCSPVGEIEHDDLEYIINTVKESEVPTERDLIRFGLM